VKITKFKKNSRN